VTYDPFAGLPGGFSPHDGTLDFYGRINALIHPEMVVLDLGAGRAAWFEDDPIPFRRSVRSLKGKVARLIAADVAPAVLENRAVDEQLLIVDGGIPLENASVDLVICDYVFEHVADPRAFAAEVDRILKPGGWLCARTPHRNNMVSIAARLVSNRRHAAVLSKVQPDRKEIDVFPTVYRLNTRRAIARAFPLYEDASFVFRSDPAYFLGRKTIFKLLAGFGRFAPASLIGNIFVFLRKRANGSGTRDSRDGE
jgi:SAM-dependent methyltransferase